MPSDTILTSALRNNLQSLQNTKRADCTCDSAHAGGNKTTLKTFVPESIGEAAQDFCTQSLSSHASGLTRLLEEISQSIKTLEQASQSISELSELIKNAESIALEAQKAVSADEEANTEKYEQELDTVIERIGIVTGNAEFAGVNLLTGDTLTTRFGWNERNAMITQGNDLSIEGLELDYTSLESPSSVTDSIEVIREALDETQSLRLMIAGDLVDIQTRQDFTQETISTLEAGKKEINITALSEEGANLLALQTKMTLSATSLSLASPSQEEVLRLF
ncbi:MAG: hypothetical protein KAJ29_06585 [Alphaproteobacteria bacterium]|nr:hypothetical protein [Alphaproteobacteria bacterium]